MNCKKATRMLSDRLDRDLSRGQRVSLALHLLLCRPCRRFQAQILKIRRFLHKTELVPRRVAPKAGLPGAARERIRAELRRVT